jgi:hypothetical protein
MISPLFSPQLRPLRSPLIIPGLLEPLSYTPIATRTLPGRLRPRPQFPTTRIPSEAPDTASPALESNRHSDGAQVRRFACPREQRSVELPALESLPSEGACAYSQLVVRSPRLHSHPHYLYTHLPYYPYFTYVCGSAFSHMYFLVCASYRGHCTLCTYLGRRAGGCAPHSTSRVLRRCIDPCAPPAAVPLDPG